jgi:hypothetical protein
MTPLERKDLPKLIVIAVIALALIGLLAYWLNS